MFSAHRLALAALAAVGIAVSCMLPNDNKGASGFVASAGTCSGQPPACAGLSGSDCSKVPGCQDSGTCTGVATNTGDACGSLTSFASCTVTPGCFWQANCGGDALGTCGALSEQQCTVVPGCVWTSAAGTGGATSCSSFQTSCSADSDCDCGFRCLTLCATCAKACAHACQSDADCAGTVGPLGAPTPNCKRVDSASATAASCSE